MKLKRDKVLTKVGWSLPIFLMIILKNVHLIQGKTGKGGWVERDKAKDLYEHMHNPGEGLGPRSGTG